MVPWYYGTNIYVKASVVGGEKIQEMVYSGNMKIAFPFLGKYKISLGFGIVPVSEEIRKKYREWGIKAHNGIDFVMPEGMEVRTTASGKVVQSGVNGDYGISIRIMHRFGESFYAHFGIRSKKSDINNGYNGYVDAEKYL